MRLPPSVQPLEVLWLLIGLIGLAHSLPQLLGFLADRRHLSRDGVNGGDNILTALYIGICASFGASHLTIIGIGLVAMTIVPPASSPSIPPTAVAITVGVLVIALASDFGIWWLAHSRLRLQRYLRRTAGSGRLTDALATRDEGREQALDEKMTRRGGG